MIKVSIHKESIMKFDVNQGNEVSSRIRVSYIMKSMVGTFKAFNHNDDYIGVVYPVGVLSKKGTQRFKWDLENSYEFIGVITKDHREKIPTPLFPIDLDTISRLHLE